MKHQDTFLAVSEVRVTLFVGNPHFHQSIADKYITESVPVEVSISNILLSKKDELKEKKTHNYF